MLLMDWIRATFCMSWRLLKKYKEIIIYVLVGCQDVDDQINDKRKKVWVLEALKTAD